ncbi:4Fe-4S dicluster domain-containing protein [Salmonella enterica]|nr:4Fe-4S dicluster domain-containing protein [Salmonella enterica]ECH4351535.1 4Fe-4S dicluster domain-containing protein [Salmonella enterica]ECH7209696.1 4Fe-4S dicluster domain-containing protein [Salmonella enterica]ECJ3255000.1 4Fe-4S dicluster domain-containing protein [Salmonella enterica]ECK1899559.1 4Fe-4S dicluster domain-containing protein [Salmonella enterica]
MRYGMVIDLQKCVGCTGCVFACKAENNTTPEINWCDKIINTSGVFPDISFEYISTMCNHCDDAPCVSGCPTQAMHKSEGGLTLHDPNKCIGCKACMVNCPYGVISFNWNTPHKEWKATEGVTILGTYTPAGMLQASRGEGSPHSNPERATTYPVVRQRGTVEKCTFCDHRLKAGLQPACVDACPSQARIVGDLDDPNSEISRLIKLYNGKTLRPELGTGAKVFYIREYTPSGRD